LIWLNEKYNSNQDRIDNKEYLTNCIENDFSKFDTETLIKKLDNIWIPCWKINYMSDIIENDFFKKEKYIKEILDPDLWKCVVPYEFIKYSNYKIEEIKNSPNIEKNKFNS
jgi:crotonobetainyl-CoA:carnitine CoA-transferase CaiB-like acyl-CoA transferase